MPFKVCLCYWKIGNKKSIEILKTNLVKWNNKKYIWQEQIVTPAISVALKNGHSLQQHDHIYTRTTTSSKQFVLFFVIIK